MEKGYSSHSIARKNSSLRLYFKYLRKQGVMVENPMEDIKQPILEKVERKLKDEEVGKIIELIKENERDLLLFHLVYFEKIKVSEAITIKAESFQETQGILYLRKKAIYVTEKTRELLKKAKEETNEGYLLHNQRSQKLTESGAYFVLKNYLKQIERNDVRPIDLSN